MSLQQDGGLTHNTASVASSAKTSDFNIFVCWKTKINTLINISNPARALNFKLYLLLWLTFIFIFVFMTPLIFPIIVHRSEELPDKSDPMCKDTERTSASVEDQWSDKG